MVDKRVRIGGGLVSDPNTVEVRDTYFVSLEKGVGGGAGRTPEAPMTLAAAKSIARSLDGSTKGLYGTKLYLLPTFASQDIGVGVTLNKVNLSLEGISLNGVYSNPSMYSDDASGLLLNITADTVEVKGLSLNAKASSVTMINLSSVSKPSIEGCRFFTYGTDGTISATPEAGGIAISQGSNLTVNLADIRDNIFMRCATSISLVGTLNNSEIKNNRILGPGYLGQSVITGISVADGKNVLISDNYVYAGNQGSVVQGTTGITCSNRTCAIINNAIGGWTNATAGTAKTGGTVTIS